MNIVRFQSGRAAMTLGVVAVLLLSAFAKSGAGEASVPQKAVAPKALPSALAGTEWRLVEFQSMDDAQGTTRPQDPSLYTMRLNADGTINMRLNCNRANGTWTADQAGDPSSGGFTLGPLASTKALCPPPSMDGMILKDAGYIRAYVLKEGRIYLSLMADGGIYVWEPLSGVPSAMRPDAAIESVILNATPDYTGEIVGDLKAHYAYEGVDLNGDGREEVLVYLMGSFFCGTGGCTLLVLRKAREGGYAVVSDFPITQLPVIVSPGKSNGWNDIWRMESGGGGEASYVRHSFDGRRYVKKERIGAEKAPEGRPCLAGEVTYGKGMVLEPRN
ncbi:MAG: META domain-containing protein [Chlorobium sp.]|uniref:META domain-containing protein n=1 Tax=Chlorobium sp. TaxID=1095 RepID=UPI0025B8BBD1|nr:META domain-containing protein [Chlorobium sp.]MCF8382323.1 META domain-containing protein [Chlorobium sp.]